MKAELLREMPRVNPAWSEKDLHAAQKARRPYHVPQYVPAPAGTIIDDPDCWRLVMIGVAKPADDDCREAAPLSDEEIAERARRYDRLDKGRATGDRRYDADPEPGEAEFEADEDISEQAN